MADLAPHLFVSVGYELMLGEMLLSVPGIVAANFHPSLLPAYRGKHPVLHALRQGERWIGLTVHVMDTGLNTGDILYQVRVRVRKGDSVATVLDRIMNKSVDLVSQLVADAENGRLSPKPQPKRGASTFGEVGEEDFHLDWTWDAEKLCRWIQTSPGQCSIDIRGRRAFLMDAATVDVPEDAPPGTLLRVGRTGCTVKAGKGGLYVRRIWSEQDGEASLARFCRNLDAEPGELLI